ncbi:hypothetical protein G0D86_29695 (plasmid) [Burkholderia multivorans]|uniref:hypothetical protein n=1 Tax=Burkholderia multivorans TaxID=87883 RepID=UPI0019D04616|nr:hypothetical protein [Burkholderia multivorans]QSL63963.1 hypothetical protein G0D86_29695 [Burkholderia multivorans]
MLNAIKAKMEAALANDGIAAEVTFCRKNMLSVFCEDAAQFCKAKGILSQAAKYEGEDCDPEIGFVAYFTF